ncbi:MAG: hypothetical protein AMS27_03990 [Bacteroides sp. SM23_62_1]|nr:MAG: hypothetical protein AMS27_03990 [Bacteroides sp. SM23_62_1]
MKKIFLWVFITFIILNLSNAQYKVDSMCGTRVLLDKNGKLLARYKPEIPGAAYDVVVKLAVDFWKSCPDDPTNNLPLYMTNSIIRRSNDGGFTGSSWPHNPICVHAGVMQGLAIDWRNYSGDNSVLEIIRNELDHQIQFGTTPPDWEWASVPYASSEAGKVIYDGASLFDTAVTETNMGRGDGSYALEVDKIGDMGIAYLKFYEITGETKYLNAAFNCADALANHVRKGVHTKDGIEWSNLVMTSPWPFRVKAENGEIQEDYTSHVVDNLRLLEEFVRIKDRIQLSSERVQAYQNAIDIVWNWLYSAEGPVKTSIWKGYFEDIRWDPVNLNRVNNSPMEFARYLIKNPENDPNINVTIPALIWWVKNTFGEPGMNAINEQTGCYEPMGSHTARYASICALWYDYSGDEWFKEEAFRHFNHATYMTEPDGFVQVGHSWGGSAWFSDGYADYIRHFMEGLAAIPEWAPAGENHLLRSSSIITEIIYQSDKIVYSTYDDQSNEVLRLDSKPKSIYLNGMELKETKNLKSEGWTWQPLEIGGILRIFHARGEKIEILF